MMHFPIALGQFDYQITSLCTLSPIGNFFNTKIIDALSDLAADARCFRQIKFDADCTFERRDGDVHHNLDLKYVRINGMGAHPSMHIPS